MRKRSRGELGTDSSIRSAFPRGASLSSPNSSDVPPLRGALYPRRRSATAQQNRAEHLFGARALDILWTIPGISSRISRRIAIADKRPVTPGNRRIHRAPHRLYVADLFAGAGGLTEGFRQAGFTPIAAVEFDKWAACTYAANFGEHVMACPIEEVVVSRLHDHLVWSGRDVSGQPLRFETPEIDVLVGGPPCQGFSPLGRMNDWDYNDPRNKLWREYARVLEIVLPRAFVLENVPELLKSSEFERLRRHVKKLGYSVKSEVLNASFYGVPQARRRAIVVGSRVGMASLPVPILEHRPTVRGAIGDLPLLPNGDNWHIARNPTPKSRERYAAVPQGGNRFDLMRNRPDITPKCWLNKKSGSTDVFGRMWWDEPAPTIRTEFFKPEKGRYLHPEAHRPITIREAARLQTFPDEFAFVGSNVQVAKQIGNAVPVELGRRIAIHVRSTVLAGVQQEQQATPIKERQKAAP
ncbi:MAG TPA: DNA cytosine methyltransferase [Candidatus Sulfotelmatobacter sp.]|nr:DNA cytosine methyltransferase [Candidatus Sulfotelmatobacter sp.]